MYKVINGIQHLGVGTAKLKETWKWYRKHFGLDIPLFDSIGEAPLMQHYNRNQVIRKDAVLVLNLKGGAAMEILQPLTFESKGPNFDPQMGDLGIFVGKIKTSDLQASYDRFLDDGVSDISPIVHDPSGRPTFYVKDINGLLYQMVEENDWFAKVNHIAGGILGGTIGVSNMEKSLTFYHDLLGFDKIEYDISGVFDDFGSLIPGGEQRFRRVLLSQSTGTMGNWGAVAGRTEIELVQALDRTPVKIFKGRQWGDTGFIHLGFDVKGMKEIEKDMTAAGHPFTCDSSKDLKIGKTQVHCTYVEDPDNTLIEFIEVYKVPLIEKWGLYMNVENRDPRKPLPSFMLKLMKYARVKD